MKQQNSKTKKTLLSSVIVLIVCVAMLLGTTFAWFTDSVSNTGNRIQAGKLKVKLLMYDETQSGTDKYVDISNGTGDIFKTNTIATNSNATLWEPGKTQIVYLAVENAGNLAVKYNAYIDVTDEGLVGSLEYVLVENPNANGAPFDLSGKTWADIKTLTGVDPKDVEAGRSTITTGVLDEIAKGTQNERDYVALAVHMKEDAGNAYQDKDIIIDVTIAATQMTAEEDGFGSDTYDAGASAIAPPLPVHEKAKAEVTTAGDTVLVVEGKTAETTPVKAVIPTNGIQESLFKADEAVKKGASSASANVELIKSNTTGTGDSISSKLTLSVDNTENRSKSITYDISMSADVTTITKTDGEITSQVTDTYDVKKLSHYTTVSFTIGKKLENVAITHSGVAMIKSATLDESQDTNLAGLYKYDSSTGIVTIKTRTFSPFVITYDIAEPGVIKVNSDAELAAALTDIKTKSEYWNTPITIQLGEGDFSGYYEIWQYPEWNEKNNASSNLYRKLTNDTNRTKITIKGAPNNKSVFSGRFCVLGMGNSNDGDPNEGKDKVYTVFDGICFKDTVAMNERFFTAEKDKAAYPIVAAAASSSVEVKNCTFNNAGRIVAGLSANDVAGGYSYNFYLHDCSFKSCACVLQGYMHGSTGYTIESVEATGLTSGFINVQGFASHTINIKKCNVSFEGTGTYIIRVKQGGTINVNDCNFNISSGHIVDCRTTTEGDHVYHATINFDNSIISGTNNDIVYNNGSDASHLTITGLPSGN